MNAEVLQVFMSGAIAMGYATIALLFYSFWRRSRIGLLGLFSVAFSLLAVERVILVSIDGLDEVQPFAYLIRLIAFLAIIAGIASQNRRAT